MYTPKPFKLSDVPKYVTDTAKILIDHGYQAYLVGGAVRDLFLGRTPKDFDIATNSTPEQTQAIMPKSVATGARFGNVTVIAQDETGERYDVDVTTFRKEEDYFGGRWPTKVEFTDDITADLSRRDFTINAMAIDMNYFLKNQDQYLDLGEVLDPFDGIQDLKDAVVRAVRNPVERFEEDGLRAYKACRVASELSFVIEPATFLAIKQTLTVASKISMERIRDELTKIVHNSPRPSYGFRLLDDSGLLNIIIPELVENKNVIQPEWHEDDVFEHSLKCMDIAEDSIKFAALLHDVGKARTKSEDEHGIHFYSHDVVGSEMARDIMTRLRFGKHEIDKVALLIRHHMFYYPSADWRTQNPNTDINNQDENSKNDAHGWTDGAVRRFIRRVGGEDNIDDLMKLRIADANSNKKSEFDPAEIQILMDRIARVREQDMVLQVKDLDIGGEDLAQMGIARGPEMGKILNELLELVIDDPSLNSKEKLIEMVRSK